MKIAILNGPNLNMSGSREQDIYGNKSLEDITNEIKATFDSHEFIFHQTNDEAKLISLLHDLNTTVDGVVLNPGGLTHRSVAVADAVKAVNFPVVEVHMSHILAREDYRKRSLVSGVCRGTISGFGLNSYTLGVESLLLLAER
ncbi:MAG: type II 3-dehydroquinate dehydratase [Bacteroidales bacterium]